MRPRLLVVPWLVVLVMLPLAAEGQRRRPGPENKVNPIRGSVNRAGMAKHGQRLAAATQGSWGSLKDLVAGLADPPGKALYFRALMQPLQLTDGKVATHPRWSGIEKSEWKSADDPGMAFGVGTGGVKSFNVLSVVGHKDVDYTEIISSQFALYGQPNQAEIIVFAAAPNAAISIGFHSVLRGDGNGLVDGLYKRFRMTDNHRFIEVPLP